MPCANSPELTRSTSTRKGHPDVPARRPDRRDQHRVGTHPDRYGTPTLRAPRIRHHPFLSREQRKRWRDGACHLPGSPVRSAASSLRPRLCAARRPQAKSRSLDHLANGPQIASSTAAWVAGQWRSDSSLHGALQPAQSASGDLCLASASLHQSGSMALLYSCNSRAGHPRRARVGTSQVPRRQLGWWSQLAMRVVSA